MVSVRKEYKQTLFSAQYIKNGFTNGAVVCVVRVVDNFRCSRCDGTIQEVDLTEDLMVDGETYECVKSFCYLGDTLDGDGGADLNIFLFKVQYPIYIKIQNFIHPFLILAVFFSSNCDVLLQLIVLCATGTHNILQAYPIKCGTVGSIIVSSNRCLPSF